MDYKKITAVPQDGPKLQWHTEVPRRIQFMYFLNKKKPLLLTGAFLHESTTPFEA